MDPITLRIRSAAVNAKARALLAEAKMERRTRLAGYRALEAIQEAFRLEEQVCVPRMPASVQSRWREQKRMVENALRRITKQGWP